MHSSSIHASIAYQYGRLRGLARCETLPPSPAFKPTCLSTFPNLPILSDPPLFHSRRANPAPKLSRTRHPLESKLSTKRVPGGLAIRKGVLFTSFFFLCTTAPRNLRSLYSHPPSHSAAVIRTLPTASLNPSHVHNSPSVPAKCIPGFRHAGIVTGLPLYFIRTKCGGGGAAWWWWRREGRKDEEGVGDPGGGAERKSSTAMWDVKGGQRESKTFKAFLARVREVQLKGGEGEGGRKGRDKQDSTKGGVVARVDGKAELVLLLKRVGHLALERGFEVTEQPSHR